MRPEYYVSCLDVGCGGGGGKSKIQVRSAFRAVHNMPNKRARRKKPVDRCVSLGQGYLQESYS